MLAQPISLFRALVVVAPGLTFSLFSPCVEAKEPAPPQSDPSTKEAEHGPAPLLGRDNEKLHIGGFGGPSLAGTTLNGSTGALAGFEASVLFDHRLALGLAAHGLVSQVDGPNFPNGETSVLGFGYGGASLRYHFISQKSPFTLSVGTLLGAAGLTLLRSDNEYDWKYEDKTDVNVFFVAEPSVQVHLHLTRWMRVGVGGGYRFVRGPRLHGIEDGNLEAVTGGAHLHFGWF